MIGDKNILVEGTLFERKMKDFDDIYKEFHVGKIKKHGKKDSFNVIRFPEYKVLPVIFKKSSYLNTIRKTHHVFREKDENGEDIEDRYVGFLKNKDFNRKKDKTSFDFYHRLYFGC